MNNGPKVPNLFDDNTYSQVLASTEMAPRKAFSLRRAEPGRKELQYHELAYGGKRTVVTADFGTNAHHGSEDGEALSETEICLTVTRGDIQILVTGKNGESWTGFEEDCSDSVPSNGTSFKTRLNKRDDEEEVVFQVSARGREGSLALIRLLEAAAITLRRQMDENESGRPGRIPVKVASDRSSS